MTHMIVLAGTAEFTTRGAMRAFLPVLHFNYLRAMKNPGVWLTTLLQTLW
jgi:hypothetical protein